MEDDRLELQSSQWKAALGFAGSTAFGAMGLAMPDTEPLLKWGGAVFFVFCAVVFLYVLIRPQTLILDSEGFSVTNPIRGLRRYAWRDIDSFFIWRLPKGAKAIAFNLRANASANSNSSVFKGRFFPSGVLPGVWPLPRQDLVELLNAWLARSREDPATSEWREGNRVAEEPVVW